MSQSVSLAFNNMLLGLHSARSRGWGHSLKKMNRAGKRPVELASPEHSGQSYLFSRYPELARRIPWTSLGNRPTPVEELGTGLGLEEGRLWVKRDDLTSTTYGGNKVRKLEHLLTDAGLRGSKSIITIGGLGSNHALATAVHGKELGFAVHLCLFDQPITKYVKRNLAGFLAAGARIHYCSSMKDAYKYSGTLFRELKRNGHSPYFIGSGGTCDLSTVGHVNAAMELAGQVEKGLLPVPHKLFVAAGTCGTISGLIAGLKIAGLSTMVTGVKVVDSFPAYPYIIRYYARKVADSLRKFDPSIPRVKIKKSDFELLTNDLGGGYGVVTEEGLEAVDRVSSRLSLETTYTGKTLAACMDYCRKIDADEKILFWNSYNSTAFEQSESLDDLPVEIQKKL